MMDSPLSILARWLAGAAPTDADWQVLMAAELADQPRARAWGIQTQTARSALEVRWQLLQQVALNHEHLPVPHGSLTEILAAIASPSDSRDFRGAGLWQNHAHPSLTTVVGNARAACGYFVYR